MPSASASRASATTPTSCSPPPRCWAWSSTRARSRGRRPSSPAPPRQRSTRSCARACCAPRRPRGRFEFAHALVREAVYDELNALRRARLHRRAADALRGAGRGPPPRGDRLAPLPGGLHGGRARRPPTCSLRAGRRALERLAYEDAAERFERALEALELADAQDEAGPVLLARGDALLRAGEPAQRARRSPPPRGSRAAAATRRCWPRRRSASPASAIAIVDLDAEAIARLEEALEALGPTTAVAALAAAGAPRGRALLRARPRALGGAQRRGRRRRARGR